MACGGCAQRRAERLAQQEARAVEKAKRIEAREAEKQQALRASAQGK